jgi:hypothetical protein
MVGLWLWVIVAARLLLQLLLHVPLRVCCFHQLL